MGLTGRDRGAPVDPDGEMFPLLVDPAHAGRGVGRMLLTAAHEALRAAGCTESHLFTHEQTERGPGCLRCRRLPPGWNGPRIGLPRHPAAGTTTSQATLNDWGLDAVPRSPHRACSAPGSPSDPLIGRRERRTLC
jgi:GNAT superfamily N-acetyltransferase